jgi:hypothetical protein
LRGAILAREVRVSALTNASVPLRDQDYSGNLLAINC